MRNREITIMRTSKLQHGLIPKGQQCPFVLQCQMRRDCVAAAPKGHTIDFSCGMARFFDIFGRDEKKEDAQ